MEINEDTLELLERRLSERVEKRARARLVAIYGLVASVIMGAIGFFGYDLVESARSKVDTAVEGIEDDAKRFALEAVTDSVDLAEKAAERASRLVERVSIRLEIQDDWLRQRERVLRKNEERVIEAQVKVDEISADIERRLAGILETVDEIEGQLKAQSERSKDVAGIANVAEVAQNLANLTRQVQALDDQLREVREKAPDGQIYTTPAADRTAIDLVYSESTAQTALAPTRASGNVVVYFQFAGVKREEAEAISAYMASSMFPYSAKSDVVIAY